MSQSAWTNSLANDSGWNRPYIDDEELIPRRYKTLRTKVFEKNLICASNGNIYVFLPTFNKWSVLCSDESRVFLNSIMDMESASVNYEKAFKPFASFVEANAIENLAGPIPTSICIGTTRLRVNRSGESLALSACEAILVQNPSYGRSSNIASLCYMPLSSKMWPTGWTKTDAYPMYRFIAPLFPNLIELQTIEWAIGNSLVDPVSTSRAIILYGEGGTGKSTLLAAIKMALMGCCGSIPDKSLVGLAKGMSSDVASIVVSSRIVTAGDVGGIDDNTNLSVIKSLTGHDYISIPPLSARSACSLFYATNRLDDPRNNREWLSSAIMRRVIVVLMSVDALQYTENIIPQDSVSRLDFALRCVHTRLTHSHPPVSVMSIILTLLGSLATEAMPYITEAEDDDISAEESIIAMGILSGIASTTSNSLGALAKKISPNAVIEVRSMICIARLKPTTLYYEATGTAK